MSHYDLQKIKTKYGEYIDMAQTQMFFAVSCCQ
jgi:hypothetical protein